MVTTQGWWRRALGFLRSESDRATETSWRPKPGDRVQHRLMPGRAMLVLGPEMADEGYLFYRSMVRVGWRCRWYINGAFDDAVFKTVELEPWPESAGRTGSD